MTDHIEFTEAEFSFRQQGVVFHVRTEVGDGPARVVVEELSGPTEPQLEGSDE